MEPSATPKTLLDTLLETASIFVMPDWRALVALFPIFLAILFLAWFLFTARKFATLGPRRRAPARVQPVTPPNVHMPGGSAAPILAAIGATALFAGMILGGIWLLVGATVLVITLGWWFREGLRDYDHLEPVNRLPAVVHQGPPPGVHMPGPSTLPLLGALGTAALFAGLVFGGLVLAVAVVFLVFSLAGWMIDALAEYRKVEEADTTGHLENPPSRRFPKTALQLFAALFAFASLWQLGILPPAPATAGGDPGASPGASAPPGDGAPPGATTIVANTLAFDLKEIEVAADQPFTIFLVNEDPPGTPHDVEIRSSGGEVLKPVPATDGGESMPYDYEPLAAGDYVFICSFHPIPAMTGTLTVQ